jgi:hypothetical protein
MTHTLPTSTHLSDLRADPREWLRRGMLSPSALDALVEARLRAPGERGSEYHADPVYADFFVAAA